MASLGALLEIIDTIVGIAFLAALPLLLLLGKGGKSKAPADLH